jgi:hypothetical protein
VSGADIHVDWARVEKARQLAGLKGNVTNIPAATMTGTAVITAYHDLFEVRMAKSDLRARPIFHHTRESIEAHLTIVFAALALSRHLQNTTGLRSRSSCARSARSDQPPSRSTANASPSTPSRHPHQTDPRCPR